MIIDRYISNEVSRFFVVTCFVLVVIFTTFSLGRYLVDANAGLLKFTEVIQLTGLKALISLEVLLPVSFYLAVMIGMGRLHTDSEIYAMRALGISEKRALRPVMILALALAIVIAVFSTFVRPWAYNRVYEIKSEASASSEIDRIQPSQFYVFEDRDRTVFVQSISNDGKDLHGVFIRDGQANNLQVISAATGQFEYLVRPLFNRITLYNARVFKRVQDGPDVFARFGSISLWIPAEKPTVKKYFSESITTGTLRKSSRPADKAEFQWRLLTPVSTLLLALLAIPLSRSRPRQGRYARTLLSLVVYAVYFSLLDISRSWVQQDIATSIWWVPTILGLVVMTLYTPWNKLRKHSSRRHA